MEFSRKMVKCYHEHNIETGVDLHQVEQVWLDQFYKYKEPAVAVTVSEDEGSNTKVPKEERVMNLYTVVDVHGTVVSQVWQNITIWSFWNEITWYILSFESSIYN